MVNRRSNWPLHTRRSAKKDSLLKTRVWLPLSGKLACCPSLEPFPSNSRFLKRFRHLSHEFRRQITRIVPSTDHTTTANRCRRCHLSAIPASSRFLTTVESIIKSKAVVDIIIIEEILQNANSKPGLPYRMIIYTADVGWRHLAAISDPGMLWQQ